MLSFDNIKPLHGNVITYTSRQGNLYRTISTMLIPAIPENIHAHADNICTRCTGRLITVYRKECKINNIICIGNIESIEEKNTKVCLKCCGVCANKGCAVVADKDDFFHDPSTGKQSFMHLCVKCLVNPR